VEDVFGAADKHIFAGRDLHGKLFFDFEIKRKSLKFVKVQKPRPFQ